MIHLDKLSKRFPGQKDLAVDSVTMDIPRGEIVVLVGPSGCGKTTTMKLINRLIEPTSGRIIIDGDDVTDVQPDELRRSIGYVIQQIGLFPHRTIAQNIATVPVMCDWDKKRIDTRIDELLDKVGLDPAQYRDRYPKELSGGQRQRVGVARAMSADPPVMLMDEPFGAIDPITRERLQNEFLRLQAEERKTIIFVTHDIDEAIKMGDRIAILGDQSHIQQFDTPERILTGPANDFVEDFIGSGASLKRLNLTRVRDVETTDPPLASLTDDLETIRRTLAESTWTSLLLLDENRKPCRWVNARDLSRPPSALEKAGLPVVALVEPQATLSDALNEMLISNGDCSIVIDGKGVYQGVVDIETMFTAIRSMRAATSEYYEAAKQDMRNGERADAKGGQE